MVEVVLGQQVEPEQPQVRMGLILTDPLWQAVACALAAFAVYLRTLAPTVMWYDMGEFATGAYVLGIAHNTGYPLYMLIGKLFTLLPIGDIAYRVNLMSAFFAALTVGMVYMTVFKLTRRRGAAVISAMTIAFSSTLWSNATWAESYDLNAFLTILIVYLLLGWTRSGSEAILRIACLVLGLSLGNHRLILVTAPAMLFLILDHERMRAWSFGRWLTLGGFFLLGFAINLYIPIRAAHNPPVNWGDPSDLKRFLTMITTGYGRGFVNPFESMGRLSYWITLMILFPPHELTLVGLFVAVVGAFSMARGERAVLVATILISAGAAGLIAVYGIHNIFNYFQPIYLMLAIWLGAGAAQIIRFVGDGLNARWINVRVPASQWRARLMILLLLVIPGVLLVRNFPILDRSQRREAADFAHYVLSTYDAGVDILADFWSWTPVEYAGIVERVPGGPRVLPALSIPGLDQDALIDELIGQGHEVYLSVSTTDSPRLEVASHKLQLTAPYVIQYYPTYTVPLPAFKDLLVPAGGIYRVVEGAPDLTVEGVPSKRQRTADFAGAIELRGFDIDRATLARGEPFRASYYWSVPEETQTDFWADILFTDAAGDVATQSGIPLWLHSHWLGGGAQPTSMWEPGTITREVYDGLVPRLVAPGAYTIRAYIYTDPSRTQALPVKNPAPGGGAILGVIRVR